MDGIIYWMKQPANPNIIKEPTNKILTRLKPQNRLDTKAKLPGINAISMYTLSK